MKVWFKERPDILREELESLSSRSIGFEKNERALKENQLILNCIIPRRTFDIDIGEDLLIDIEFPDNYPYFRPEVILKNHSLPRHQHPSGKNLCLIPRPSQFWEVVSIGEFLQARLPMVLSKGKITDPVEIALDPDEQAEPISENYINQPKLTVISERPPFFLRPLPSDQEELEVLEHGFVEILYPENSHTIDLLVDPDKLEESLERNLNLIAKRWLDSKSNPLDEDFPFQHKNHHAKRTKWYLLNRFPPFIDESKGFDEFYKALKNKDVPLPKNLKIKTRNLELEYLVCLIFPEEIAKGEMGWGWMFVSQGKRRIGRGATHQVQLNVPIQSIANEDVQLRIPDSAGFQEKTISVIGLGTLGALSAIEIAKNGAKKLILMDFDKVDTTSSVRWPLGYKYVGQQKTVALKNFLKENFPKVEVEILIHRIGSLHDAFRNENEKIEQFLNTDFVFDSSAEEGVNHFLSQLCRKKDIPYIMIEGRRGGWGGVIARVLPVQNKGCWMCLQHALYDGTITPPPDDSRGGIQAKGCGDISFTGSSFDMYNISLAGVKLLAQTLNGIEPGYDVGIMSMVDENEKPVLPRWEPYDLQIHPKCPYCHENNLD